MTHILRCKICKEYNIVIYYLEVKGNISIHSILSYY
jgi:hypothetical protein